MSNGQPGRGPERDSRRRRPNPKHQDNYARKAKAGKAIVCSECELVLHGGRWYRGAPPLTDVASGLCPACVRVRDRYPAGTIRLPVELVFDIEEIRGLVRNAEEAEKAEHPLERLMGLEEETGGDLVVTTTGVHLARRIANKLERRLHRQARFTYSDGDGTLRVEWSTEQG